MIKIRHSTFNMEKKMLITITNIQGGQTSGVSLRKSHDIVILSFCNIVMGQTTYVWVHSNTRLYA